MPYNVPRAVQIPVPVHQDRPVPYVVHRQVEVPKPFPVPQVINHEKHVHIHPQVHVKTIEAPHGWQAQNHGWQAQNVGWQAQPAAHGWAQKAW